MNNNKSSDFFLLEDEEYYDSQEDKKIVYEHFRFIADKGQSIVRVDKFLTDRIEGISRNRIQQAAEANFIIVNENPVKSNYKVKPLDVVSVVMDTPKRELKIIPEDIPLNIFYEDDDLMLINKPPGIVVHPGHGNYTGTLLNGIAHKLGYKEELNVDDSRLGLVHRIDKDTSGLILIAKNDNAKTNLSKQFFNKTTKRKYVAIVWGDVEDDIGTITGNIGRDNKDRMLMKVYKDSEIGKNAVTHYKVLERFGYVTLVECTLETGRTHQIRVHMKHIGHTLFNDSRYGGNEILRGTRFTKYKQFVNNCFNACPRQCLHAKTLGFIHPASKKEMFFESDIPEDMKMVIDKWRKYTESRYTESRYTESRYTESRYTD